MAAPIGTLSTTFADPSASCLPPSASGLPPSRRRGPCASDGGEPEQAPGVGAGAHDGTPEAYALDNTACGQLGPGAVATSAGEHWAAASAAATRAGRGVRRRVGCARHAGGAQCSASMGGRVHEVVRWRGSGGWEGHAPRSWCRSCRLARNEALGLLPSGPAWKLPSLVAKLPAGVQYGVVPALVVAGDDLPDGWPDEGRNTRFLACGHRRRDGIGGCGRGRRSAGCGRGVGEWFVRSCGGSAPCTAARAARRTGSAAA